jgi:hypothetical protein
MITLTTIMAVIAAFRLRVDYPVLALLAIALPIADFAATLIAASRSQEGAPLEQSGGFWVAVVVNNLASLGVIVLLILSFVL